MTSLTLQHSGSVRYYGHRVSLRYDLLRPEWLDRALQFRKRNAGKQRDRKFRTDPGNGDQKPERLAFFLGCKPVKKLRVFAHHKMREKFDDLAQIDRTAIAKLPGDRAASIRNTQGASTTPWICSRSRHNPAPSRTRCARATSTTR